jgi:ATP-dependent DNA helicase RecG
MPSALETLVKILKLEREQGCKNTAVIGGMAAYGQKWSQEAHTQARKPEHHLLVEELTATLQKYEVIEARADRQESIGYMLDRITGRAPIPESLRSRLEELRAAQPPPPLPQAQSSSTEPPPRRDQDRPDRRDKRQQPDAPRDRDQQQNRAANAPRRERPDQAQKQRPPREDRSRPQQPSRARNTSEDDDDSPEVERFHREEMSYDSYEAPRRGKGRGRDSVELDVAPMPRLARVPRRPRPSVSPEEAEDILRGLSAPVSVVKGIGPGMAKLLEKVGIFTVEDMLNFLPRRYDDYTRMRTISQLIPDPDQAVTVIGTVVHTEIRVGRGNRKDFFMIVDDASARMPVTFFGQHFKIRQIRPGMQVVLSGPVTQFRNQPQMANPDCEPLDAENLHTVGIVPVYALTEGLSGKMLRKLMKSTVEYWADRIVDYIPEPTLERAEIADLGWAIRNIHFPEGWDHLQHSRTRFVFDELLVLQLAMLRNRREWQSVPAAPILSEDSTVEEFMTAVFPYPLTGAQRRAIQDIRRDIASTRPMNRLIQGDVGSGKTAVATVGLALAYLNGKQSALMAPTSILAEQHYRGISATLEKMPEGRRPVVALLTSALTTTERQSIYRGVADGSINIVIGTHALIQDGVEFHDLGLAIIDEQHRFGVEQRKSLRGKGTNPHLLVMTATPIPRTLALTIHADLDLSVMDEMPPGRIPIQTKIVQPINRERMYNFVEIQIKEGRQAFIVHPLVEASEKIEAPSAMEAYERLQQVFFRYKIGLLHGKMKPQEKDEVMAAFSTGAYDILVTTSVAEVGVNVPNATVMVIEGANRFGLSQLHQFRGRVGRGEHASYCLLLADTNSEESMQRLHAMEETTDGFKLAEMDWRMRGAGDLVGTRQSGGSRLQLMEDMSPQLVELAQREARTIYEEDADMALEPHRLLAQRVSMLRNERTDVS